MMMALQSYFCMLSEKYELEDFILVTDNAAPQRRRRQSSSDFSDIMMIDKQFKFSVVSPDDDKCPSRPKRISDDDLSYYSDGTSSSSTISDGGGQSEGQTESRHRQSLQSTTTLEASIITPPIHITCDEQQKRERLNVWLSLNQSHFQYSRIMNIHQHQHKRREDHSVKNHHDDSSSKPSELIPREARWKF